MRKQHDRGVAVVTGGTAGVGRATVRELARRGWDVGVLARGAAGLRAAEHDISLRGQRGLGVPADVAQLDAVRDAAARIESELGPIGLWVNVAFVGALRTVWDTEPETFRRITDVTYLGQVHGTRAALDLMRPRDQGVIINVSSALAYRGIPLQAAYCGAKHAVKGFTESLITELRHEGSHVRVCLATLPGLNTPQFDWNDNGLDGHPRPVAPVFQPEVAARLIAFLADHPRRNAWVGISSAYTVLGNRVAPALLDRYLARTGFKGQVTDHGPRHGSNVFQPRDDEADRGARGMFNEEAHERDPWSAASMALWGAIGNVAERAREVARRP
ncbi:MAG TPA: SDR family oxidoreductase [Mycobacteriales bacterium]|nr:SDR family oxidoreductase [Mycobacteriales bacterium]HVU60225.1 SDR family oxidoreductase [Mycobacteriales bacterium]